MKVKRLLVAAGVDATNDALHALVVDRALQRDALSGSETMQRNQLLADHRALSIVDERLPVSVTHLNFRHNVAQLACVDGEVGKEVLLVFIDATEPTERHGFRHARHRLELLQVGHGYDE